MLSIGLGDIVGDIVVIKIDEVFVLRGFYFKWRERDSLK